MRSLLLFLALVQVSIAFPVAASGSPCGAGFPALGEVEVSPTHSADVTYYADDRGYPFGDGIWLYQESNGIFFGGDPARDLQRGGSSQYIPEEEVCFDPSPNGPDALII